MTRQFLFLLTTLAFSTLLISMVVLGSKHRSLATTLKRKEGIIPPINNDKDLGYSEINIASPRPLCVQAISYSNLAVPIKGSIPMPSQIEDDVTPTLSAKLVLENNGEIFYWLNSVRVWRSSAPHNIVDCTELNVLKSFAARTPIENWKSFSETSNGLRLHLAPLAITSKQSDSKRRIVWSFLSGFDASALCTEKECEIPLPLPPKQTGSVVLMSKSRSSRLVLLPNADLVTLESGPDVPQGSKHVTKLKSSLIGSICLIPS